MADGIYEASGVAKRRRDEAAERMRRDIAARNKKALETLAAAGYDTTTVMTGVFAGMRYHDRSVGSLLSPKLIGTYESQLHRWIRDETTAQPRKIIDIGCAEGYYAVGLARLSPASRVVASDTEPLALEAVNQLAQLNGTASQVTTIGCLTHDLLQDLVEPGSLVFCDIEGFEQKLLDPASVPALRCCSVIVETHEAVAPGVVRKLVAAFIATHRIECVWSDPLHHRLKLLAEAGALSRLRVADVARLIDEQRPQDQSWLRMVPVEKNSSFDA
jgi:predicted RNA methylase